MEMDIRPYDFVDVMWEDQQQYPARVEKLGSGEKEGEYFIHYPNSNRRFDEWVGLDRIVRGSPMESVLALKCVNMNEREKLATLVECMGGCGGYFPPEYLGVQLLGMPEIRKEGVKCKGCVALNMLQQQDGCADERKTVQLKYVPASDLQDGADAPGCAAKMENEADGGKVDGGGIHADGVQSDVGGWGRGGVEVLKVGSV